MNYIQGVHVKLVWSACYDTSINVQKQYMLKKIGHMFKNKIHTKCKSPNVLNQ